MFIWLLTKRYVCIQGLYRGDVLRKILYHVTRKFYIILSSRLKFLDIGRRVFKKGVIVVVLEICLSEKALIKAECNLEAVGNGGKSALLNTKETAILFDLVN